MAAKDEFHSEVFLAGKPNLSGQLDVSPLSEVTTKRKDFAASDDDDDDNDDDGDDDDEHDVNNGVAIIFLIVGKLSNNDSEQGFEEMSSF